jgi:hypothetical protein
MSFTSLGAAERCARQCLQIGLAAGAIVLLAACGEPTAASDAPTFTADVAGAVTQRLTGSAMAGSGAAWSGQGVVQVTLPNVGPVSVVVLTAEGGANVISLSRASADLPVGTYTIGRLTGPSSAANAFSAGYTVRRANGLQVFMADSGSVTIAQSGGRVAGAFTLYASSYDVIPMPTPALVGTKITPIESGRSLLKISGEFDAAKR